MSMFVLKYKYHITSGVSEAWIWILLLPLDLTSLHLFPYPSHWGVIPNPEPSSHLPPVITPSWSYDLHTGPWLHDFVCVCVCVEPLVRTHPASLNLSMVFLHILKMPIPWPFATYFVCSLLILFPEIILSVSGYITTKSNKLEVSECSPGVYLDTIGCVSFQ